MECLTPAVSCIRWSSSLNIGWSKTVLWWNRLMKYILWQKISKIVAKSPHVLPNKFVAGGIISKLPPSWRDFATSLKHKRQEFTIDGLIGTLDVEEKARAKDIRGKGVAGASSANLV